MVEFWRTSLKFNWRSNSKYYVTSVCCFKSDLLSLSIGHKNIARHADRSISPPDQSDILKYNTILLIWSSESQMISAHIGSRFLAMKFSAFLFLPISKESILMIKTDHYVSNMRRKKYKTYKPSNCDRSENIPLSFGRSWRSKKYKTYKYRNCDRSENIPLSFGRSWMLLDPRFL